MTTLQPHRDGWTVADLYELPDDGMRYELVDGSLLVSPPAEVSHYSTAFRLGVHLDQVLGEQWRIGCNPGVGLDRRNYREPDLVVMSTSALGKPLAEPADLLLAVELMSPSSVLDDRLVKPAQYARFAIPHYWRLEPAEPVLITYAHDGDTYRETGRFTDEVAIDDPVRLRFRLADLLA